MKTNVKLAFIISLLFILQSCQKDPLKNINEGGWNNERSIIDIKFKGQIGSTVIDNILDFNLCFFLIKGLLGVSAGAHKSIDISDIPSIM